jgi:hypothetical protein
MDILCNLGGRISHGNSPHLLDDHLLGHRPYALFTSCCSVHLYSYRQRKCCSNRYGNSDLYLGRILVMDKRKPHLGVRGKTTANPDQPLMSEIGTYYTAQLFYERHVKMTTEKKVGSPIFTLHKNIEGFINFGARYVAHEDPTGYKVTQELLKGDYVHWDILMKQPWFVEAKKLWDRELDAKLMARGLDVMKEIARGDDEEVKPAQRLMAAKFLATRGYVRPEEKTARGRPTNEEVEGELKRAAGLQATISEDLARIGKKGTD